MAHLGALEPVGSSWLGNLPESTFDLH
jgi:hypothetical protein